MSNTVEHHPDCSHTNKHHKRSGRCRGDCPCDYADVCPHIGDQLMPTITKVTENRLRRVAQRQGFELHKSRARDPRHQLYGKYQLHPADVFVLVPRGHGPDNWLTAGQVAEFLGEQI